MTDNRKTELLCKLLEERGAEWKDGDAAYEIEWNTPDGRHCSAVYWEPTFTVLVSGCTPEQAIAATLGRPKAKSHPYGYERDTGAYDCTRCECGCINDISATYCNDCGGEIEVDESAEKEYYDGYSKHTVFAKKHDDGSLEFCERRYIPEDAAALGSEREKALEELVKDMYRCITHANEQDWFYFDKHMSGCGLSCVVNGESCGLEALTNRMSELGIEVD